MKIFILTTILLGVGICNADLIGHWGLDEKSGNIAHDTMKAHDGTLINYSANSWTSGQVNGALKFDGVNDYLNMGNVAAYNNLEQITISSWINLSQAVSDRHFIFGKEFAFKIDIEYQKVRFLLGSNWNDWSGNRQTSHITLSLNNWYHVAATYDGQYKRIYINGQNTDSMYAPIAGDIGGTSYDVTVGAHYDAQTLGFIKYFKGRIDDVAIFDKALSQEDISNVMMNGALSVPEPCSLVLLGLGAMALARRKK